MIHHNVHVVDMVHHTYYSNESMLKNVYRNGTLRKEINEFIHQVNFLLMIIELFVALFGILGNTLALIVINRRSLRRTSSSVFITYLAIFDSSVLMAHLMNLIILNVMKSYVLHCLLICLTDFVTFSSVWIMVIMTIERCIAVCSPLLAKRFCTQYHARAAIYMLVGSAFAFFSGTFPLVYTIDREYQKCGVRPQYQRLLRIIKPPIFYFIPDVLLLANLLIIYKLFEAKRRRKHRLVNEEATVSSLDRHQQQLTVMLVTVSLSFYVFTTPAAIDYILQINPPQDRNFKTLKARFLRTNLSSFLLQISSATNFIFYCLTGSKFRTACLETLSEIQGYVRGKIEDHSEPLAHSTILHTNSAFGLDNIHREIHYNHRDRPHSVPLQRKHVHPQSNTLKRLHNGTNPSFSANDSRASSQTRMKCKKFIVQVSCS